ncbi:MAG: T9SS type A sorting domain-containing protein, partial [candidate division Zixibacteria bacterium]|nr:T9SS type A sorting domain-containing protein [candidate division Zixibacteria bacterium]
QNYPNPFNPTTVIEYYLRHGAPVELAVYNLLGERVKTIISEAQPAGWHTATWDGNDNLGSPVASGVYLYQLKAGDYIESRKMLLLR